MELENIIRQLASNYPGFPPFVHHIMARYELGQTREEIVAELKKEGVKAAIDKLIRNTESTHAMYIGKDIVLPPTMNEDNNCISNMILSASDNKQEGQFIGHGFFGRDESVPKHDDGR